MWCKFFLPTRCSDCKISPKTKNFCQEGKFAEKIPVRQNVENKIVTVLSPFCGLFMLTPETEKVQSRPCGKTCGECGKLKIFNRIFQNSLLSHRKKSQRKSSQKWKNTLFGLNYVDTCTLGKNRQIFANCFRFLSALSKNRPCRKKQENYFCGIFTKQDFGMNFPPREIISTDNQIQEDLCRER